jgi:hypothetical protein
MRTNDFLTILVICVIIFAMMNIIVSYIKISDFKKQIFGYATATGAGYLNITVNSYIILNMSRDRINWGSGSVNVSFLNATLYTNGDNDGVVERGNWSGSNVKGFYLENLGNLNCSIFIQTGKEAHDFFMSNSSTNEEYKIKITNKDSYSCSGTATIEEWINTNKSSGGGEYCSNFGFDRNHNEIYIDVLLTVPKDANKLGAQSDDILIIGNSVA